MSSEVITVPYNNTATISTIQQTLLNKLVNQTIGYSSLSYTLDNQVLFGLSLIIAITIMLLLILGLDHAYFHWNTYVLPRVGTRLEKDKWHRISKVLFIAISILLALVFYPPLITPTLQRRINPNFQIPKKFVALQPIGIGLVLFEIVLVIGYGIGYATYIERRKIRIKWDAYQRKFTKYFKRLETL
jgi:hypothetical protein